MDLLGCKTAGESMCSTWGSEPAKSNTSKLTCKLRNLGVSMVPSGSFLLMPGTPAFILHAGGEPTLWPPGTRQRTSPHSPILSRVHFWFLAPFIYLEGPQNRTSVPSDWREVEWDSSGPWWLQGSCSGHVPLDGSPWEDPRTIHLGIPQNELVEFVVRGQTSNSDPHQETWSEDYNAIATEDPSTQYCTMYIIWFFFIVFSDM